MSRKHLLLAVTLVALVLLLPLTATAAPQHTPSDVRVAPAPAADRQTHLAPDD